MTTDPELEIECPICGEIVAELAEYDGDMMCDDCRMAYEAEAHLASNTRAQARYDAESRLLDQLIQHIDHDSPPGLGARELANLILQMTSGIGGKEAALLVDRLSEMIVRDAKEPSDV